MHLVLKRSERTTGMLSKNVLFGLTARVDLTAEESANVEKYKFGKYVIYNSENTQAHAERARAQLSSGTLGGTLGGLVSAARSRMSLSVTVNSLIAGQYIECKDLDELIAAEEAIREACTGLRNYLDVTTTFDGSEEVIEYQSQVAPG